MVILSFCVFNLTLRSLVHILRLYKVLVAASGVSGLYGRACVSDSYFLSFAAVEGDGSVVTWGDAAAYDAVINACEED